MKARMNMILGAAAIALAVGAAPFALTRAADSKFAGLDMAPTKVGGIGDLKDMKEFCGTKKIKVAYADGWGGNYWRHITRGEFEDEAAKCPNITEVRYTDGEFKPEKQNADIEGLIA